MISPVRPPEDNRRRTIQGMVLLLSLVCGAMATVPLVPVPVVLSVVPVVSVADIGCPVRFPFRPDSMIGWGSVGKGFCPCRATYSSFWLLSETGQSEAVHSCQ